MSKKNFCTLFDSNYLLKGVAMLQSLKKYCPDAHVYVLCMDSKTQEILGRLNLTFVTCVLLADVEDEELLRVKKDRNAAEYCWTLSSCFTWYVLQKNSSIEFITYLDADLLFYSSVSPIFDEIGCSSSGSWVLPATRTKDEASPARRPNCSRKRASAGPRGPSRAPRKPSTLTLPVTSTRSPEPARAVKRAA